MRIVFRKKLAPVVRIRKSRTPVHRVHNIVSQVFYLFSGDIFAHKETKQVFAVGKLAQIETPCASSHEPQHSQNFLFDVIRGFGGRGVGRLEGGWLRREQLGPRLRLRVDLECGGDSGDRAKCSHELETEKWFSHDVNSFCKNRCFFPGNGARQKKCRHCDVFFWRFIFSPYLCTLETRNIGVEVWVKVAFGRRNIAEIAQLVEHDLAKVGVASSSLVFRSENQAVTKFRGCFFCVKLG